MGLLDWLRRALAGGPAERARRGERGRSRRPARDTGLGLMELSRRLGLPVSDLQLAPVTYDEFRIPKRGGGARTILAPNAKLKALQRRVLHRVLGRLKAHPSAMGFERGRSIVTHARLHAAPAVIVRMDVREFFPSTEAHRVREYFRAIGWGSEAVMLLMKWCTWEGGLPQGAPTSPRLSNLVNYRMDARLAGLAAALGATYSRYADDLAFSFARDDRRAITAAIRGTKAILADLGYSLHLKKKLSIRRRHQRQAVTGLVVNDGVRLPRETRRLLRAARHRLAAGRPATLTPEQLAGWGAFLGMVERQAGSR